MACKNKDKRKLVRETVEFTLRVFIHHFQPLQFSEKKANFVFNFLSLYFCGPLNRPVDMTGDYYMALSHTDWELPNSRICWLKWIFTAV